MDGGFFFFGRDFWRIDQSLPAGLAICHHLWIWFRRYIGHERVEANATKFQFCPLLPASGILAISSQNKIVLFRYCLTVLDNIWSGHTLCAFVFGAWDFYL